jgi:hypothetical protein
MWALSAAARASDQPSERRVENAKVNFALAFLVVAFLFFGCPRREEIIGRWGQRGISHSG